MRFGGRLLALGLLPLALLLFGACSSNNSSATKTAGTPAVSGNGITEVTTDNKFSATEITIKAGQSYTLTQDNKGAAIHNVHVLEVKSDDGKDIMTPLTDGGKSANISFAIGKIGTYTFQCDVHPTEMKGTLTVQ